MRILLLLFLFGVSRANLPRVKVKDGMFVSQDDGRTLLFRGINSVVKHFPWYDSKIQDPARQQQLKDWGFNNVRLGMMWSGLEPEEGQVNETYSNIIQEIVDNLGQHGIHSYLDMHQDVLIGNPIEYWGIPEWVYNKMEAPEHPYPWPMKDTSGFNTWACGYFSQTVSNAFQQLYSNKAGTADYFANFWVQVAKRFMNNTAVLGYELMNEPWTGDIFQDASLLLPGNAGHDLLEPFFNRASDAIRTIDDQTIIFWEPVTYAYFVNPGEHAFLDAFLDAYLKTHNVSILFPLLKQACGELDESFEADLLHPTGVLKTIYAELFDDYLETFNSVDRSSAGKPNIWSPGFTAPPGGPEYLDRTVLSWHYYCWALNGPSSADYDPVLRGVCDDFLGPMVFQTVEDRAVELGGSATFLTEFGLCEPNATLTNSTGDIECNFILDQADLHLESWSYWDTAGGGVFWDNQGNPVTDLVKVFTRPYPPATAGTPLALHYDHVTRLFEFTFAPDLAITAPTEVYVPPLVYTEGYVVEVPDGVEWVPAVTDKNKIHVTVTQQSSKNVTIKISPL